MPLRLPWQRFAAIFSEPHASRVEPLRDDEGCGQLYGARTALVSFWESPEMGSWPVGGRTRMPESSHKGTPEV